MAASSAPVNQAMPGGGWVTTHEDITEQRKAEERLHDQKFQLDTALNNMMQGLCMFDRDATLVLCNQRYLDMYDLPAEQVKPGIKLRDLLQIRLDRNSFSVDPDVYVDKMTAVLATGQSYGLVTELNDGRVVAVENRPIPGGGWVSTHDDITEQRNTERQLREQKLQLDTALNNMTQGLTSVRRQRPPGVLQRALPRHVPAPRRRREGRRLGPRAGRYAHCSGHVLRHRSRQIQRGPAGRDQAARADARDLGIDGRPGDLSDQPPDAGR